MVENKDESIPITAEEKIEDDNFQTTTNEEETKSTVRKLSLFDTLEEKSDEKPLSVDSLETKAEPVFQDQIQEDNSETGENPPEKEFEAEEFDNDNEYNQETEDELLDIPTFLRRQAN